MKKNGKKISTEYIALLGGMLLGIGFLLLDFLGAVSFLRTGISFVMDPVAYQGNQSGQIIREYLETFVKLDEFREEYNELTIQLYEQEVESSFYAILKEENESLKQQITLGDSEQKYVLTKSLGVVQEGLLRINKGERDGVATGDVVTLGNMYIGLVAQVDWQGAMVRLPTNKASNLEVVVVSGDLDQLRKLENIEIITKGIVRGTAEGIKIENMSRNVSLGDGDVVVVNDSRVGQYLVLGYLVGLSENPAATSRSGYVSPILEYDKVVTLFVNTQL